MREENYSPYEMKGRKQQLGHTRGDMHSLFWSFDIYQTIQQHAKML